MKRILLFLLVLSLLPTCACSANGVSIDILDVGKADCIVIRSYDKTVMIDTGEKENLPQIKSYLKANRINAIDTLILSHFDKDHIGCAEEMILDYNVQNLLISSFSSDREEFGAFLSAAKTKNIDPKIITEDYNFRTGECTFTVFPPMKSSYDHKEDNNASLIVEMEFGENRLLFCGDAMEERIEEFLSENHGSYSFVKLPYHGRFLDNYDEFLIATKPKYSAMTCSKKNPPDQKTLSALDKQKVKNFNTENGTIHLTLDLNSFSVVQ